jgi:hypothetical protein
MLLLQHVGSAFVYVRWNKQRSREEHDMSRECSTQFGLINKRVYIIIIIIIK